MCKGQQISQVILPTIFCSLWGHFEHSSLVDYLAQVIYAKNCPTTFYCIFQLVWVPMSTTQSIRVCFLSSRKHFFHKGPPFEERKFK